MGEEQKGEEKKEGGGENKEIEEKKKEEETPEILLKVDMHCEGCARKVEKSLRKCEGVEEVKTDGKLRRVVVRGRRGADPVKLCEIVQKRTGRSKAQIISPLLLKPPKDEDEDEKKDDAAPPPKEKKEDQPKPITVVLKIRMHCDACAQVIQKRIKKIEGVETVEKDISNEQVIVKGFVDPAKLVEDVYRRTRRQASVVQEPEKEEEKKEEPEKKEEEKGDQAGAKKLEYWPPKYYLEHASANSYAYPPPEQVFSDENPNACSVM